MEGAEGRHRKKPGKLRKAGRAVINVFPVLVFRRLDRPPILIGGAPRSGTTLLLSVLSSHPSILAVPGETRCFTPTAYRRGAPMDPDAPFHLVRFTTRLLTCEIPRSARRWCEKTPKNVLFFRRIIDHFEGRVRLIHLVRDGRDVITSRHPMDPSRFWVTPERWIRDVRAGLELEGHEAVMTLRYEDLVTDIEGQLARLGAFLGEDFDTGTAWHEQATLRHSRAWFHEVVDVHARSVGRWRAPEHRAVVDAMMARPEVPPLLARLGYETRRRDQA